MLASACQLVTGEPAPASEEGACRTLKRAAVELCLSSRNLDGRYFCDSSPARSDHYVLALRYETTPDELVGSNLIGWFGIRKSDGKLFEWDIAEDRPVPLASHCPFESSERSTGRGSPGAPPPAPRS